MQYADKEAIAHFRLGEGSSFKLFDIHPDLQIQGFVNEISELSRGRLDRIERILSFGTRDHQMFSGRFIFSLVSSAATILSRWSANVPGQRIRKTVSKSLTCWLLPRKIC